MKINPAAGDVFEIEYPFTRENKDIPDQDGIGYVNAKTWRPGTYMVQRYQDDFEEVADGVGKLIMTVIGTFKPSPYPERVFFKRSWVTPNGRTFGRRKLYTMTLGQFRQRAKGYRNAFVVIDRERATATLEAA